MAVDSQSASSARQAPLYLAAQQVLPGRARIGADLVKDFTRRFEPRSLNCGARGLSRTRPTAFPAKRNAMACRFPTSDDSMLPRALLRPWWATWLPGLAVHVARRRLEDRFGQDIATCVDTYERQLQSWIRREIEQLVKRYELEVAPIREQVRRLAASEPGSGADRDEHDRGALETDIRAGEQTITPIARQLAPRTPRATQTVVYLPFLTPRR